MKLTWGLTTAVSFMATLGSSSSSSSDSTTTNNITSSFTNPIWSGFHPDPTCTFVPELDSTFFCATSSFLMFPGLPIYASKDLINWSHISNALNRPAQLPNLAYLPRGATSGIYAPTLRYRDGTFYLLTTLANQGLPGQNHSRWDNFILQTSDPYDGGSWSDPIHFDFPGIDPDPHWDEDGQAWVTGSMDGAYLLQAPIDLDTGEVTLPYAHSWNGTGLISPEASHYYERDGQTYMVIAEGGTRERHRANVARAGSFRAAREEWQPHPDNPVLTAYGNESSYFQAVGHADMFRDATGQWWAVALAARAGGEYADDPYNSNLPMGRETVLTPVTWTEDEEGGWPVFKPVEGVMEGDFVLPESNPLPEHVGRKVGIDDEIDFEPGSDLPMHLFHWRLPVAKHYAVAEAGSGHEGSLMMRSSRLNLTGFDGDATRGWGQSFLARKQAHSRFRFSVDVEWKGEGMLSRDSHEVGVSALQDQSQHFDIGVVMLDRDPDEDQDGNETVAVLPRGRGGGGGEAQPYIRFRGISTTPFRLPERMKWVDEVTPLPREWMGADKLRFQVEALNTTHYAFSAGPVTGNEEGGQEEDQGGLRVFGYCRGNQLHPFFSGVVLGPYATSNGRYGEGSFETYISRWRYRGLEQVVEQPEDETPIDWS